MRRIRRSLGRSDDDPLEGVANFFDIGVIFSLGFMAAMLAHQSQGGGSPSSASGARQEVKVDQDKRKTARFDTSRDKLSGEGERLGTAYRLKSGEMVYIPDGQAIEEQKEAP